MVIKLHRSKKYFTIGLLLCKKLTFSDYYRKNMNTELLLSVVPQTAIWSAKTASIMISSNIFCIVAGRYVIQIKGVGASLPLTGSFSNFTLPELLASTSLGHIVGTGAILGFAYLGLLS